MSHGDIHRTMGAPIEQPGVLQRLDEAEKQIAQLVEQRERDRDQYMTDLQALSAVLGYRLPSSAPKDELKGMSGSGPYRGPDVTSGQGVYREPLQSYKGGIPG